ncbi:AAA family ATPase [Grimontia hollisae]|uniref:AAA family ATPase n=1 Tax=Grimontia hollisae TaxID=673 RepID=UPI000DFFB35A|nr:AAA family ATPase [Grimontia hollisae]STQ77286.1 recombination protein F [Grimontia hollisae]
MKIKTLKLTNYRAFEDLELDLDPQLTVLIARNGAGKSSILDAISSNLGAFLTRLPGVSGHNPKDSDFRVSESGEKPPFMRIYTCSDDGVEWDRTERRDKTKKTQAQIPEGAGLKALNEYVDRFIDAHNEGKEYKLPVFIYYGTGRGVFDVPQRKRGFGKKFPRFEALSGALESRTNFKRFVEYFYFLEDEENRLQKERRSFDVEAPELRAIRHAVNKMMPQFSNPRSAAPAGLMVDWAQENGSVSQLRIEQLSDGYRTTLAMVMDIAARMAEANPYMEDPLKTEGMILIDEVDLHLHPAWQREFLPALINTFPKIQFVVSTHSPFIIQSLNSGKLVNLDHLQDGSNTSLKNEQSIEDIVEQIMDVPLPSRSARLQEMYDVAQQYYDLLEQGNKSTEEEVEALKHRLDELVSPFSENVAYHAFLERQRIKAGVISLEEREGN